MYPRLDRIASRQIRALAGDAGFTLAMAASMFAATAALFGL